MLQAEKDEVTVESELMLTDVSDVKEVNEEDKMKCVETSMKQLTLEDQVPGEAVLDKSSAPIPLEVETPSKVLKEVEEEVESKSSEQAKETSGNMDMKEIVEVAEDVQGLLDDLDALLEDSTDLHKLSSPIAKDDLDVEDRILEKDVSDENTSESGKIGNTESNEREVEGKEERHEAAEENLDAMLKDAAEQEREGKKEGCEIEGEKAEVIVKESSEEEKHRETMRVTILNKEKENLELQKMMRKQEAETEIYTIEVTKLKEALENKGKEQEVDKENLKKYDREN